MKKFLIFWAALTIALPLWVAALTVVTDSDVSTGDIVETNKTSVSGNSSADAEVRTHMDASGSNTEIRTEKDGAVHIETIEKVSPAVHVDVHVSSGTKAKIPSATGTLSTSSGQATSAAIHLSNFFSKLWAHLRILFHF